MGKKNSNSNSNSDKSFFSDGWMFRVGLGLVIFVVFFVFSKLFTFVIFKFKKSDKDNKNSQNLLFDFIIKAVAFFIIIAGVLASLIYMGVSMSTILVVMGSAGLGIALALKEFLSSMVNGFIILTMEYYHIGDLLKIGDKFGFVREFNLLNTTLVDAAGYKFVVPNTSIVSGGFINMTANDKTEVSVDACISNSDSKLKIKSFLEDFKNNVMPKIPLRIDGDYVYSGEMTADGTMVGAGFMAKTADYFLARKNLRFAFREYLREKGILLCTSGSRYLDN